MTTTHIYSNNECKVILPVGIDLRTQRSVQNTRYINMLVYSYIHFLDLYIHLFDKLP